MTNLKNYIIGALTAISGVLYLLMNWNARKAKKAESERDIANDKADFSEKQVKRVNERKEIDEDIAMGDEPHIDERLSKYYRD